MKSGAPRPNDPHPPAQAAQAGMAFVPDDPAAHRRWRRRLRVFQIGLLLFFVAVALRLVQIQIVESDKFTRLAERQYRKLKDKPAVRGPLLDRNGEPIATSTIWVSIEADPVNVGGDAAALAKTLSKITRKPQRDYLALLSQVKRSGTATARGSKGSKAPKTVKAAKTSKGGKPAAKRDLVRYVKLEKSLDPGPVYANRLDTLKGVTIVWQSGRIYHTGVIAGQLLGTTAHGDSGIAGIELGFDSLMRGTDGYTMYQLDGAGNPRPAVDYPRVEPVPGNSLVLTLDLNLQEIAENELEKGVKANKAEGGVVVMLNPKTGEVLAVAQYPRVDPAEFGDAPLESQKLRAVTDMVEPGSVFKIVTAAAAIDNGLIRPERHFNAENGRYVVHYKGQRRGREIKDVHKLGDVTFREAVEHSSNIVMAKASDIIGNELLYKMARDFGFGMKTGVDIPAEIGGLLKNPTLWSAPTRHSLSFGYEVGVTPIQIAAAYAAVANGGVLMRPYVLKREVSPDGTVIRENEPSPVRRVVTEESAAMLGSFLEGVVERGTATEAKFPGIRIAGKTGTSKRLVNGKYTESEYTASFVGYFPAEDPRVVCLVMLDNPSGISYYGGTTSAPIFKQIVGRIMGSSDDFAVPAPIAGDLPAGTAGGPGTHDGNAQAGRAPGGDGQRGSNAGAAPKAEAPSRPAAEKSSTAGIPRRMVPDVRGFSIRRALSLLRDEKFQPVVNGSGVVVSQNPPPGEPVSSSRVITLNCSPRGMNQGGAR
jgi:cell division protein FtsI (penicillin-binding protein 3)